MNSFWNKFMYFIFSIMYAALTYLGIQALLMLISEFQTHKNFSMIIYMGIALLSITLFLIALYNCIKKVFEKE